MAERGSLDAPIPTPPAQRRDDFRRRTVPLVVWGVAALAVCVMLVVRSQHYAYLGVAQIQEYEISSPVAGTIKSVQVRLYDEVKAGEIVATLDDAQVRAMISTSQARIKQLQHQLESTRSQFVAGRSQGQAAWIVDLRRFQAAEEDRRLEALSTRVKVASVEVEEERLAMDLRRSKELLDLGLIPEAEYENQRLLHSQAKKQADESRRLLDRTEEELQSAEGRRLEYQHQLPLLASEGVVVEPLRSAVEIETRALEEIEVRRQALVLRSPISGQVSQIAGHEGQAIVAGEPVVMIADRTVHEIVAYLSGTNPPKVEAKTPVLLRSVTRPDQVAESMVLRVGEGILPLPPRLWQDPRVPVYGRAVVIAAAPQMPFAPGELLQVRFR